MLYCDRTGDRTFYEEEMQSNDLAVGASGSCGFVSALHKRTVFNRIRRYSGICLCDSVFGTYPDRGLFFAEGGRCEDVLHPVSCGRCDWNYRNVYLCASFLRPFCRGEDGTLPYYIFSAVHMLRLLLSYSFLSSIANCLALLSVFHCALPSTEAAL